MRTPRQAVVTWVAATVALVVVLVAVVTLTWYVGKAWQTQAAPPRHPVAREAPDPPQRVQPIRRGVYDVGWGRQVGLRMDRLYDSRLWA